MAPAGEGVHQHKAAVRVPLDDKEGESLAAVRGEPAVPGDGGARLRRAVLRGEDAVVQRPQEVAVLPPVHTAEACEVGGLDRRPAVLQGADLPAEKVQGHGLHGVVLLVGVALHPAAGEGENRVAQGLGRPLPAEEEHQGVPPPAPRR